MTRKSVFLILLFLAALTKVIFPQTKSSFTGNPSSFKTELISFMGPNLNDIQKTNLNSFLARWDSAAFEKDDTRIIDVASQMAGRSMRPIPHFNDFLVTLNIFVDKDRMDILGDWLSGLSEILFNPKTTSDGADRYIRNTGLMIKDNILNETSSITWKLKNATLRFVHDTVFKIIITDATLTCFSQKDSTEIYNVSGIYYPEILQFTGTKGRVTWEKAGYPATDVFAELGDFVINTTRNSFTADSAQLTHQTYFKAPVYGLLTDQSITFSNKERANFPRFETYARQFRLDDIYKGVSYTGGMTFEGAIVKGTGTRAEQAEITLSRNDTLYIKINSQEFTFSKTGLNSGETAMTLYLDKDSIYHPNLGFTYNAADRLATLFRGTNPVSRSPYFNSFHKLDMYFEYLMWDMDDSKIILSRPIGAALGQAQFESSSFFNANYFMQLAGIDEYHPLVRLKRFAEWYYSETFPVEDFAKWLNKPVESVTALCIDMANRGFVFYDRTFNEVTLKKKVDDFLDANSKKKDYDVLNIVSETKAPLDNAILDLKNFRLTVNGVLRVFLSDSQRVAIYPYNRQLVIGKNRNIDFDGVVAAGLFTIYGHNFSFNYDTFKIRLQKIDSIRIAVETEKRDMYGNPFIKEIDNLIELSTADIFIDDPNNKSGLKSLSQYPIINSITHSYIFYDKIAGLEGVYPQDSFYFKLDPFNYENIDHFEFEDIRMPGEFHAGNILKPMRQYLTTQQDSSLGFTMTIPQEGIEVYGTKGRIYDNISMSNKGLLGSGRLSHLTSSIEAEDMKFFPDSMLAEASVFNIEKSVDGVFPSLNSQNVSIRWLTSRDEWEATNSKGKNFRMFDNGTELDGSLIMKPSELLGAGIVNTTDSRITSKLFSFSASSIKADTSDFNLKSPSTDGYSFIAENAKTVLNFDLNQAEFSLNTDTSVVKFPEIQYICTMTDFIYDMGKRILKMEQRGRSEEELIAPDRLLRLDLMNLDKPTFFSTDNLSDTVSFSSWKANYYANEEYIEAENISYIHIADALIQPENGRLIINRRAKIKPLEDAYVAVNNKHLLHSAKITIESTKKYSGSAIYDYIDDNKDIRQINFPELTVDTMRTSAKGNIPENQNFMLNSGFTFSGDVTLNSLNDLLLFTGAAGISHDCSEVKSYPVRFSTFIDPKNVMIPISEKPRDINDNMIFSGSFINLDSVQIYPAFLSPQKSWTDAGLVTSTGFLYFDRGKNNYIISSLAKLADQSLPGNMVTFDRNSCTLSGEGKLNFGDNFDLVALNKAGRVTHSIDSGNVTIQGVLGFDFFFSPGALEIMSNEIRMMPTLKPVNLNREVYDKAMKDMLGNEAAARMKEDLDLFGTSRNIPKEFTFEILLNDVTLVWNEVSSSFRSKGKIGIGFIGTQPVNVYVDGYVEIQRRRSGDMFDIYLKADESTWYYFSYIRGNMMVQAGNNSFNTLVAGTKLKDRKHPSSTTRVPYTYMIAVEDRLGRFLRRMTEDISSGADEDDPVMR